VDASDDKVEVVVWQMAMDEKTRVPIVILKEKSGTAKLPIWIGTAEATAIAMRLQGKEFQRPLTHDLFVTMLRALRGDVRKVEISSLKDTTYYARIVVQRNGELASIDARPSDSIAIAVRTDAPIFASKGLLTHSLDDVLGDAGLSEDAPQKPPTREERSEMLRRRIEEINPEDFGRFSF
jgi:bifunctional DNase/RNase